MGIGLMVPGRAPTPSDGRAQHYIRPGNTLKQETRTFLNGTTLTFGPDDRVENFAPSDAFYEQVLVIFNCEADINAVRNRYHDAGSDAVESDGRYTGMNSFPDLHDGYKEKRVMERSASIRLPLHTSVQNSNLLQVGHHTYGGSTVNVYQSNNRSNSPGLAHPGYSTDTRGPRPTHTGLKPAPPGNHGKSSRARARTRHPRSGHGHRTPELKRIDRLPVAERMSMYVANRAIAETTIIVPQADNPGQTFAFRINPPTPTNTGNILDIYSSQDEEYWKSLVSRNINPEYGGLPLDFRNSQAQEPVMRADAFDTEFAIRSIGHQRIERGRPSILSENSERRSPDLEGARYVGYNVPGEPMHQLNRTPTPILPIGLRRAGCNGHFTAPFHFPDTRGAAESRSSSPGGVSIGTKKFIRDFSPGRFGIGLPTRPSSAGYQFQ